ncbi:MAG: substrate-binding domain-containing protein [Lachnospiraceae bacterium]|nr:substrate-binding domain-containing protein [Lachnospiraceae bacterium]
MKTSKKIVILLGAVLAVAIVVLTFITLGGRTEQRIHKVSVIIPNSEDAQWSSFKYGLRMAAEDSEMEVFVTSTGESMTVEEEQAVITQELKNGADAVIVQPVAGTDAEDMLRKIEKKVPVMLTGQTETREQDTSSFPVTEADNYAIGEELAKEILQDYNGNIKEKTVGILMSSEGSEAAASRKQGFLDSLKDTGAVQIWELTEAEENVLEEQKAVDFLIALDDDSMAAAGKCAAANNLHGALVYGVGSSTESVYYLDTGSIECMVVPDAFNVGYQSLTEIAKRLEHPFYKMKSSEVSHTVMRRSNLFSEENQNVLYTMNQ